MKIARGVWRLFLALGFVLSGCADLGEGSDGTQATLRLGLSSFEDAAAWLRLTTYGDRVSGDVAELLVDSGCLPIVSEVYELTGLEVGDDRSVVIEGFTSAECKAEDRTVFGYRGGISITEGDALPHYHVPLYREPGVTSLPEDLNISQGVGLQVDYCDVGLAAPQCEGNFSTASYCHRDGASDGEDVYWCVPTCERDSDCAPYHVQATCSPSTGWCMLETPFPLNLSSPRAFGHAAALPDGGVAFVGGFGSLDQGVLKSAEKFVEAFDPRTGIFTDLHLQGAQPQSMGLSGFEVMSDGRIVSVGGLLKASVQWTEEKAGARLMIAGDATATDAVQGAVVIDAENGLIATSQIPEGVVSPSIVDIGADHLLVVGGMVGEGTGLVPSKGVWRCSVGSTGGLTCADVGRLQVPRVAPGLACLGSTCAEVLVIGGNEAGKVIEILANLDGAVESAIVEAESAFQVLHGPAMCGLRVVGASSQSDKAGGVPPLFLKPSAGGVSIKTLPMGPLDSLPLWPAVVQLVSGSCWVGGGLAAEGQVSDTLFLATSNGVHPTLHYRLEQPRFGAAGAEILEGPLTHAMVFGGGLTVVDGEVTLVKGAEVLLP